MNKKYFNPNPTQYREYNLLLGLNESQKVRSVRKTKEDKVTIEKQ